MTLISFLRGKEIANVYYNLYYICLYLVGTLQGMFDVSQVSQYLSLKGFNGHRCQDNWPLVSSSRTGFYLFIYFEFLAPELL